MRSYEITTPSYAGKPLAERLVLWLFYAKWSNPYFWYMRLRQRFWESRLESLFRENVLLRHWERAEEQAKRLDRTRFEIIEIHRNQFGDIRARLRNLSDTSFVLDICGRIYGENTQAFDYEARVGSQVDATFHSRGFGSNAYPNYFPKQPLMLNCLVLQYDREELRPLWEEEDRARIELEKDLGPTPLVLSD